MPRIIAPNEQIVILQLMKNLYKTFKKAVYNPAFYQKTPDSSFADAFRFYFKSTLIFSAVMTIALGIFFIPIGLAFINDKAPGLVRTYFPADLTVNVEKGQASANVAMPYFVPIRTTDGATSTIGTMQNILVVDTTHDFDKKTFADYKTYILITKNDIVTSNDGGQINIQSLRGAPFHTLSQAVLLSWVATIQHSFALIAVVAVIVMYILLMLGYLIYLGVLFIFALIPLLIGWIKKIPLSYGGAYKMSLYAIVPALALKTALNLIGVFFLPSYLTFLVFILVITLNMRNEEEEPKLFE